MFGKGWFSLENLSYSEIKSEVFASPELSEELTAQVNALKKVNKLECQLIHIQNPVQDSPEEPPYFPAMLFAMETRNERFLKNQPVKPYSGNESEILEDFALNLIATKSVPKSISVIDDRTEALLSKFCEAMKQYVTLRRTSFSYVLLHITEVVGR